MSASSGNGRPGPARTGIAGVIRGIRRVSLADVGALWRDGWRFLGLATDKARRDDLSQLSAALAFITMVSLVPLLAAGSSLGAQAFIDRQDHLVEILGAVLPYSEEIILAKLTEYLEQARAIRGLGFLGLLATGLLAFVTIERALNRVWNVDVQRPFSVRLRSFTLVVFWGPLVIGATYSSLFFLSQSTPDSILGHLFAQLIPFAVSILGLAVLYWLVPYTRVAPRSALAGALVAAVLLELLRRTIGLYILLYQRISVIYGSFGLALLFMISIQLAWWLVLLGSEVAFAVQHRSRMWRPRRPAGVFDASWLGLAALLAVVDRFRAGRPIMPREELAGWLALEEDEVDVVLRPLCSAGLLSSSSDGQGFLLSCDPYRLEVTDVLGCYDVVNREILLSMPAVSAQHLGAVRETLEKARRDGFDGLTLASLVAPAEPVEA